MSVAFLSNTLPSVYKVYSKSNGIWGVGWLWKNSQDWGLAQIQWHLRLCMQNKIHWYKHEFHLHQKKNKKSNLSFETKTSNFGHFGSLKDLGIKILLCQHVIPIVYANVEVNRWHQSTIVINDGINFRATSHMRLKGRPHAFENAKIKMGVWEAKVKEFGIDMCLTSRSSVSRLVSAFSVKIIRFQLWSDMEVFSLARVPSWIGVGNKQFYPMKEGSALKPSSSKLGTCQG